MATVVKRKALSGSEKLAILNKFDGDPGVERARHVEKFNVLVATVNTIVYKREYIEKYACNPARQKIMSSKYEEVEERLLAGLKEKRALNIPIQGPLLQQKAAEIALKLNVEFTPSNGWLDRFQKHAGISYYTISGEAGNMNNEE